jgi:hypothetical protein
MSRPKNQRNAKVGEFLPIGKKLMWECGDVEM